MKKRFGMFLFTLMIVLSLLSLVDYQKSIIKANTVPQCVDCYDDGTGMACWGGYYNGYQRCWNNYKDGTCIAAGQCGA